MLSVERSVDSHFSERKSDRLLKLGISISSFPLLSVSTKILESDSFMSSSNEGNRKILCGANEAESGLPICPRFAPGKGPNNPTI